MHEFCYPVALRRGDKPGRFTVRFKDVPEAITWGDGVEETLWQAADCWRKLLQGAYAEATAFPLPPSPRRASVWSLSRRPWQPRRPCI